MDLSNAKATSAWDNLTTFGINGQKARLARLNYQIATIEEGKGNVTFNKRPFKSIIND